MKLMNFCALIFSLILVVGCSSDDDSGSGGSNSPISGKSFGVNFTMQGGSADEAVFFNVDSYTIQVSTVSLGCDAPQSSIVAEIICPSSLGVHTNNVYATFYDSEGDFQTIGTNNRVEITSNSGGRLKGKVNVPGLGSYNMTGTFDVPFCD
ncbi:hypothetical protein [Flavobacterium sp. UBA6135]|uniref:hypothetical protein n=1 Tax=Flavobacterium sp. UBA6135 TaxID=1946553 RepID=UPI0025B8C3D7|nr:hypothetical protein [Flavobacterium sp. UBA6135]